MKKECVEDYDKIKISEISLLSSNKKLNGYEKQLKLEYARDGKYETDVLRLALTDSLCNFGGWRLWFICDECNKRVGTLFYRNCKLEPKCRNCLNLTYEARQKRGGKLFRLFTKFDRMGRYKRKIDKISARALRKGTHSKTRLKLCLEQIKLKEQFIEASKIVC